MTQINNGFLSSESQMNTKDEQATVTWKVNTKNIKVMHFKWQ